jgi:hypothetical protein
MLWFKHWHNLRNSPAMKQIQRQLGDPGFAAAIRLLEVMTQRCGSGASFNPVLTLAPPTTKRWLGEEIITPIDEGYGAHVPEKTIEEFLDVFNTAGLIARGSMTGPGVVKNEKNEWVESEVTFETLALIDFEELQDRWTARIQHAGRGQGKGGGNPNCKSTL